MSPTNFFGGFLFGLAGPFWVIGMNGLERSPATLVGIVLCAVVGLLFNLRKD